MKSAPQLLVAMAVVLMVSACAELPCRSPGTHQDVAKTPLIKNTTSDPLETGKNIYWSASDGDNGTITLQQPLPVNDEVQGLGSPGQVYTCEARVWF